MRDGGLGGASGSERLRTRHPEHACRSGPAFKNCGCDVDVGNYLPVLVFVAVGVFIGIAPIGLGMLIGPNRPDPEKLSPYECGFEAFEDARMQFDVRYYLVAILFILFDLEVAFLFPWAISLGALGRWSAGFWAMMLFLTILLVGFVYEWKKGALDWE